MYGNAARASLLVLVGLLAVSLAWSSGQSGAAPTGERVKITMFMGNSGVAQPAGVDPSNNWAINIIEKYANVDLEIEIPNYADFPTKMNLLLASGNLPDILHGWQLTDMIKAADAGAFLDLKAFWDKSPQMQKVCPALNMELVRDQTTTKKYWAIPMNNIGQEPGTGVLVRQDLIDKYNGGKYPEDLQGYLNWFKAIKAAIPDSIPVAGLPIAEYLFMNSASIFFMHGVYYPAEAYWRGGKYVRGIELPEFKEAIKVYRQLYKDGMLDKEFATNPRDAYSQKVTNKFVATQTNTIDQVVPIVGSQLDAMAKNGTPGVYWVYAPPLTRYPAGVERKYIQWMSSDVYPINWGHRVVINAKTKYPAQAWRVLEGFASDELRDAQAWGREGKEYNVVNGKRVPTNRLYFNDINDPDSHYWTLHLGIIWGFWPTDVKYEVQRVKAPVEFERVYQSSRWLVADGKATGIAPSAYLPTFPDINAKAAEARALASQIMAKTITGEFSLEDWDAGVKEWKQKYDWMLETQNKWIADNKAVLKSKGVKLFDQ
jgi:putative aldouronate transport system substrate-binding protein